MSLHPAQSWEFPQKGGRLQYRLHTIGSSLQGLPKTDIELLEPPICFLENKPEAVNITLESFFANVRSAYPACCSAVPGMFRARTLEASPLFCLPWLRVLSSCVGSPRSCSSCACQQDLNRAPTLSGLPLFVTATQFRQNPPWKICRMQEVTMNDGMRHTPPKKRVWNTYCIAFKDVN